MAKAEGEIVVSLDKEKVKEILSDMEVVGSCFKFVKKTSNDGKTWYIRAPMSMITQTKELEVKAVSDKDTIEWEAVGKHLLWKGKFDLKEVENGTKVRVTLSVEGIGSMAPIINPMANVQIDGQLKFFLGELKKVIDRLSTP